jgi:hypothetical protein
MISPERQEELESIANEIFEALSGERFEPSERGAGWAPTDKGVEAVIAILGRAKASMWKDSPAEKRKYAIAKTKKQAQRVAERLLGGNKIVKGICLHCDQWVRREKGSISWRTSTGNDTCDIRKDRSDRWWNHEAVEW